MTSQPQVTGRRRPWLLPVLLVVFIAIPIVEVWLLGAVAQRIGLLATILILIAEAVLGAWLMRREGIKAWRALATAFNSGRMPTGQLADAALVLVGGVLLTLPGFFTDIIGLLFLLPFTRPFARRLLGFLIARQVSKTGVDFGVVRAQMEPDTVIRGETVDDPKPGPSGPGQGQVIRAEIEE